MRGGLLVSYHYLCLGNEEEKTRYILGLARNKMPVVLDSGAFSAASGGAHISILKYGKFLKKWGPKFEWCASLDVIGNPEKSRRNWSALSRYHQVVPTVHRGTDLSYLRWYLAQGVSRVAAGGLVRAKGLKKPESETRQWMDSFFEIINSQNRKIKVHGFGITSQSLLSLYPWHSVDSTAASMNAVMGRIYVNDGDRLRTVTHEDVTAEQAAYLFHEWEVIPRAARKKKLTWNAKHLHLHLENTGIHTLYQAITPNGSDEIAVRDGIIKATKGIK